jgi:epoxyqueuosine reductase QueG
LSNPTSESIKNMMKDFGMTVVGIASPERFEGAPPGHGPCDLLPKVRSIVVAGVRIPDPVVDWDEYHLKMTEMEPDFAINAHAQNFYMQMGHFVHDMILNTAAIRLANYLETEHRKRSLPAVNAQHTGLGHPVHGTQFGFFSQRHAAVRAGLGEFGYNGLVLNPVYGPRVRYVSIITEADLEPDPLLTEKVCLRDKCGGQDGPLCHQRCYRGALQFLEGIDHDKVFIDIPVRNERPKCTGARPEDGFGCVYIGTCLRECPIGKQFTKR